IEADDQAIQTILLGLPEDIYAAVDSCQTAQEICLRVQQMMKGSDIGIQKKKAKLFNEWERFTSNEGESIESYYHHFLKLMNDLKRNKHFPEKIASNLKFLNNLQPEWSRHVTIIHQTKDLHIADYTQLYDFLKYNQNEVDELKAERIAKTQDPLALMENFNNPYVFSAPHQDQSSFNENYLQQPMTNPEDITNPTTAMNMALALMAKAFKLNYSTPTNNNQRNSSNPTDKCRWLEVMVEISLGSSECWKSEWFIGVQGNGNHNQIGNGHYARNCTIRPRRRDAAYLQTQLLIAQKEEAGIQLQAEEYDLMAAAADLDEIKEVNANCILMANLQQASTSGTQTDSAPVYDMNGSAEVHENCNDNEIFNMFTQEEQYTELLEPIPESHQVPQNDNDVISEDTSVEQGGKIVEQHPIRCYNCRGLGHFARNCTVRPRRRDAAYLQTQFLIVQKEEAGIQLQAEEVDNTKTRRPQPRSNTKNDMVPSASKSSRSKNTETEVEEHHRNLLLSKNNKHISSACNNIKTDSQEVISNVVCAMCSKCLIFVNHDKCLCNYVNDKNSHGKKQMAKVYVKEIQKKYQPKVTKLKKVGTHESLVTPKPRKPRLLLRWSLTGRLFDHEGKLVASSNSESQYDCSNGDNACTSNAMEPKIKRFPNSTICLTGQFCDSDLEVAFRENACFVRNLEGVDLLKGDRSTNLYTINLHEMASALPICLMVHASSTKSWLWHQRLSHLNFDTINDLSRIDLVAGLPQFKYHKEHVCPSCEQGKSKRASHPPKPVLNSRQRLHLLHMDLCGPMRIASINGKRITFLLQSPVIIIRTDNGTEFKNQTLVEAARTMLIFSRAPLFLWAEAIATACFTQNRSIIHRRFNKMPYELINGRKPDISFLHVFCALCYPKNDREDIGKLGAKGDIGFFIGYSADSCAYRVYNRRTKKIMETMNVSFNELSVMAFEQHSSKPGLQSMTSGHISSGLDLTYAPSTITTQQPSKGEFDLLFEAMYDDYIGGQPSATAKTVPPAQEPQVRQSSTASTTIANTAPIPTNSSSHATNIPISSQDVDELNLNAMVDGNTFVNPFANSSTSVAASSSSQNNVREAMTDPVWIDSMQEEHLQFKRLDVWVLVPTPDNISPLTLKWLFKNKHDKEQTVIRNKSRLVVRGYRQEEGIDFKESFASSKYVLEILNKYGMESCNLVGTPMEIKDKLDLDQNGTPVDATKYRRMIGALMYLTSSRPDIVHATCLCARYQAKPTEKHLKEVKRIFCYLRRTVNTGLWYTKDSGFELTRFSDADYAGCKDTFKSTSGGAQFLGEKLVSWSSKKQDCMTLSTAEAEYVSLSACCAQVLWIQTQLTDYGFHFNKIPIYCDSKSAIAISCNPVQHSRTKYIVVHYHLIKEHVEKAMAFEQRSSKPRLNSMTSGQISSGLDLIYASSTITMQQPSEGELDLLFEAMYDDYIGGQPSATARTVPPAQEPQVRQSSMASTSIADTTPIPTNSSSLATNDSVFELTGFSDADYVGCKDTFKSTSSGAQFLGEKLVSWSLKKRDCTALSTAKAEYVSLSACCAQVLWMRTQLTDYGFHFNKIPIYCDSKSAIAISCNPVQHSRTKHIAVRYHFIKEHVEKGTIELYFVKTDYQLADIFTKALPVDRFNYLVRRLSMRSLSPKELERLAKSQ
nr:hypothetical protein [Tanacetum cinerariifolium]